MMSALSLDAARQIADAAFAEGHAAGVDAMTVVVTDPGGHIRLAMSGDGVGTFGVRIALGKCRSALGFCRSTMTLSQQFDDPLKVAALTAVTDGDFLPIGGGVRIKASDGAVIGAAAAAGSSPQNDEAFILAGLRSADLSTDG
jgi:glc operon protein GlcG